MSAVILARSLKSADIFESNFESAVILLTF